MAFKFKFFDLDFRNDDAATQKAAIDTFFQDNAIESWHIAANETIMVTYDDAVDTKSTRFDVIDFGVGGVKGDIVSADGNSSLDTIVAASHIIQSQLVEDRMLAIQYKEGTISVDTLAENQRVSDEDLAVVAPIVYAEVAAESPGTQQTGIGNVTYVKINQVSDIVAQKNTTISGPNDNITVGKPGRFRVIFTVSFTGTVDTNFEVTAFANDVAQANTSVVRKTGSSSGDVANMVLVGTFDLVANDVVDVRVISDDGAGANFRVIRANFSLEKVR